MSSARITVDDAQVQALLRLLRQRMADLRPAMRDIGVHLREASMEAFATQTAPDGKPWAPLSAAAILSRARRRAPKGYAKRRAQTLARFAKGAKALLDTGALRNSIRIIELDANSVSVGTTLDYAGIHQGDDMAGRGRRTRIPERPFLGVSDSARQDILQTLRDYLAMP